MGVLDWPEADEVRQDTVNEGDAFMDSQSELKWRSE